MHTLLVRNKYTNTHATHCLRRILGTTTVREPVKLQKAGFETFAAYLVGVSVC